MAVVQTAVLTGPGGSSFNFSGVPDGERRCFGKLDFELVACICIILILSPSVITLVYKYKQLGAIEGTEFKFLNISQCSKSNRGDIRIHRLRAIDIEEGCTVKSGQSLRFDCEASISCLWQWFSDDRAVLQMTDRKRARSSILLKNVTRDQSVRCMAFLPVSSHETVCDISYPVNIHLL